MKVKVISLPYIFQVLYVLCFTRPIYQVSVYRTNGPLVLQVEQLCEQAGDEFIILTASLSDGAPSHYYAGLQLCEQAGEEFINLTASLSDGALSHYLAGLAAM